MVLFRVRRVKSARLDDKRSYHRRGISIHPQRPDPSELPLRDHNAAPRKSMLGGAKLGQNIYLPIRRPLMHAKRKSSSNIMFLTRSALTEPLTAITAERGCFPANVQCRGRPNPVILLLD